MMNSYSSGISVVLLYILYTRVARSYFVANMDTNAATCVLVIICNRVVCRVLCLCPTNISNLHYVNYQSKHNKSGFVTIITL